MNLNNTGISQLSISCYDVPTRLLLDKTAAKHYFQQFGKVIKIRLRPKQKMCIVEFAHEEDAQRVLTEGGTFDGDSFKISLTLPKRVEKKRESKIHKKTVAVWKPDSETAAELDSMKGDFTAMYNLKPESLIVKKTPILKKPTKLRQWKSEQLPKSKQPEQIAKIIPQHADQDELLNFIRKANSTSEEKYRVLDARDKLIRLRTVRQSNLAKARKTIGTCPDMCPEKERLMREAQHQVAVYEQISGSRGIMNHSIAVKQYSRSSADQETPLAHELRPVHVLQMTMGYMLHRIMDLCQTPDVNLAEWYHYVWDRTRGIRKDITQQELCSQGSVQLVEQCARFHIHCSARLVAEDVSVFDEKINTENLTKCLQTLKYMYHDLALKGETCANEAEFRAYIVLLNLHDGNFMWEVQQLKETTQKSVPVKFAMQVYSALDKNNYVKFFKLVKSTSYLNACILLRYFNQVRYKALRTIIKSYSPRQPYTQFPVDELGRLLAFEDVENTIAFLEYHELSLSPEQTRTHVVLNRRMFHQPDVPFSLERAVNVIESKRSASVGQIVCGPAALPDKHYENHVPHNSFDENGYLKPAQIPREFHSVSPAVYTDEPSTEQLFIFSNPAGFEPKTNLPLISTSFTFPHPTNLSTTITTTSTTITTTNKTTTTTTITATSAATTTATLQRTVSAKVGQSRNTINIEQSDTTDHCMSSPFWSNIHATNPISKTANKSIFGATIPQTKDLKAATKSIISSPKPHQMQLVDTENSNSSSNQIAFSFTQQVELEIQKRMDDEALLDFTFPLNKPKSAQIDQKSNVDIGKEIKLREKLIKKQKEDEAKRLAEQQRVDELRRLDQMRKLKLAEAEARKLNADVQLIMRELLNQVEEQQVQRRLKQISDNIKQRKIQLYINKWKNLTRISKKKRKRFFDNPVWISSRGLPEEAQQLYSTSQNMALHDMKRYKLGSPINLMTKQCRKIEVLDIFKLAWKFLFEQSNSCSEDLLNLDIFWKIGVSLPAPNLTKGTYRLEETISSAFDWRTSEKCMQTIRANNGGYFTYCISNVVTLQNDAHGLIFVHLHGIPMEQTYKRLLNLLQKNQTAIPLVIISNVSADNKQELIDDLRLEHLELITDYDVVFFTSINIAETLSHSVRWLAEHSDISTKLRMDSLTNCLRNSLGDDLWHRIRSSADMNIRLQLLLRQPNVAIELHNNALDFLSNQIIFCSDLSKHLDFPNEFKQLLNIKQQITLPCTYEYFPSYWKTKSYQIKIKELLESMRLPVYDDTWPPKNQQQLQEQLQQYLSKAFTNPNLILCKLLSSVLCNDDNHISWGNIVELLVLEKIKNMQDVVFEENMLIVVYNSIELKEFQHVAWWYNTQVIKENICNVQIEEETSEIMIDNDVEIDISKTLTDLLDGDVAPNDAKENMTRLTMLLDDLEKSMNIQQKIMLKFQETATLALDYD